MQFTQWNFSSPVQSRNALKVGVATTTPDPPPTKPTEGEAEKGKISAKDLRKPPDPSKEDKDRQKEEARQKRIEVAKNKAKRVVSRTMEE